MWRRDPPIIGQSDSNLTCSKNEQGKIWAIPGSAAAFPLQRRLPTGRRWGKNIPRVPQKSTWSSGLALTPLVKGFKVIIFHGVIDVLIIVPPWSMGLCLLRLPHNALYVFYRLHMDICSSPPGAVVSGLCDVLFEILQDAFQ